VHSAGGPAIPVGEHLKSRCAPTEPRYRVTPTGIGQQRIGEVAGEDPGRLPQPELNHLGSFSHMMYSTEATKAGMDV